MIFKDQEEALNLLGKLDENISLIENSFKVSLIPRGEILLIQGQPQEVQKVVFLVEQLQELVRKGHYLSLSEIKYAITLVKQDEGNKLEELFTDIIYLTARGKKIKLKTLGQKRYINAMRKNDIVFGIGPAGTGKTYLAMAMAVSSLKNREVQRLILTRPAVEAGEHLGFLPGDLQEKVDPYLRPLYDALFDLLGIETFQKYMEKGIIEVAPLAYMRGRTLDDSFIILDEAQNSTMEQMKMFLTRLAFSSKAVVTGDITQVDLPKGKFSGLAEVPKILKDIPGIEIIFLSEKDVVRHPLVQEIIKAYEEYQKH
ncbi:MAG: phosphate starvation-inducible protein PhoH [Firmicutes bacterium HGW-Firmicutes-13]|nr:MAG: phosphate starvation-inducible protein PhoH [Firmicutes bacterium HGW-Firmicutes-13]